MQNACTSRAAYLPHILPPVSPPGNCRFYHEQRDLKLEGLTNQRSDMHSVNLREVELGDALEGLTNQREANLR